MPFSSSQQRGRDDKNNGERQQSRNGARQRGDPERRGSSRLSTVLNDLRDGMLQLSSSRDTSEREEILKRQNFQLRRRNARLLDEMEELEQGGNLPEGGAAITADEVKELAGYRELKLKPEDMKKVVEEHATLKATEGERAKEQLLSDAVSALDIPNEAAAIKLLKREGLHVEFKDVREKVDGKTVTVRVPYCRKATDEKAELVPLVDYMEDELKEFVPTLLAEQTDDSDSEEDERETRTNGAGGAGATRKFGRQQEEGLQEEGLQDEGEPVAPMRRLGPNGARRAASGGVPVATSRGARQPNSSTRQMTDEQLEKQKRATGAYSL